MQEGQEIPTEEQKTTAADRIAVFGAEFDKYMDLFQQGKITRQEFRDTMAVRQTAQVAHEDRIKENASTDALTGLLNKGAFDEKYKATVEHLRRVNKTEHSTSNETDNSESAVILNLDLNGLKEVNDNEGHEAGNEMLRKFARLFKKNSRLTDNLAIVFRPGGDEFMGVLTNTNQNGVVAWWSRFAPALEAEGLRVSIGSADIDPNNPEESLKQADDAMYRAKELKTDGKSHYMQMQTVGTELKPVEILPQSR